MTPIDKELEAISAMLRAQGGVVGIDPNAPDHVKRAFIQMLMSCPDCWEAMRGRRDGHAN